MREFSINFVNRTVTLTEVDPNKGMTRKEDVVRSTNNIMDVLVTGGITRPNGTVASLSGWEMQTLEREVGVRR